MTDLAPGRKPSLAPSIFLPRLLEQIQRHGEAAYPEEGAACCWAAQGRAQAGAGDPAAGPTPAKTARHNRYLLTPQDFLRGEQEAARQGLDLLGVFHSHPDHPNHPSEFDREWAMPWFSYVITSVQAGRRRAAAPGGWQKTGRGSSKKE